MNDKKFEKTRKTIEVIFDIIFLLNLFYLIIGGILKILYATNVATVDLFTYPQLLVQTVITLIAYFPTRLANKGHILAGVIGIIVAIIEILFAGTIWKIVGIFLLIDSIVYIVNYKEFSTNNPKNNVEIK